MTAATAPVSRAILLDRWQGVMKWERTYGNASDEYLALVAALDDLIARVSGREAEDTAVSADTLDEDLLDRIGEVIIDRIEARHRE